MKEMATENAEKRPAEDAEADGPAKKMAAEDAPTSGTWAKPQSEYGVTTNLVHAAVSPDPATGAILTPLVMSTTFVQESIGKYQRRGYSYSRCHNPTITVFENKVAAVEGGFGCTAFATGMAACNTLFNHFLAKGDHLIISNCTYGGTNRLARILYRDKFGVEVDFVDQKDPNNIKAAIKKNTKLIFTESPVNPTLVLADVAAISEIAKGAGIPHCCDTTFATPVILKALDLGADIVLQSTTKYYDGHNMTVGGALIAKTKEHHDAFQFMRNVNGNIMTPQVAFLKMQTMKTMELRIRQQCKSAEAVAAMLLAHPKVEKVIYPGLKSFDQYDVAVKQHRDGLHGGMLACEIIGGSDAGKRLMDSIRRPWSLAENLGATESIITCPSVMTHGNMLREDRLKVGISDGFVRLSCGIETTEDLVEALKDALDRL